MSSSSSRASPVVAWRRSDGGTRQARATDDRERLSRRVGQRAGDGNRRWHRWDQAELLATGADQGEVVELVGAYEPYALELARDIGLEARTSIRIVGILDEPDAVEPAGVVVLNRVVCCWPDGVDLAAAAARLARRTLVLSFPRRRGLGASRNPAPKCECPGCAVVRSERCSQPDALFAAVDSAGLQARQGDGGASGSGRRWSRRRERSHAPSSRSSTPRYSRSRDRLEPPPLIPTRV